MNSDEFNQVVNDQLDHCKWLLTQKAREYATEDRLHNFKVAAELQGVDIYQALGGMMAKHTVSIYDMIASDEDFAFGVWLEKITDHINYLLLLTAIVKNDVNTMMDEKPPSMVSWYDETTNIIIKDERAKEDPKIRTKTTEEQ